MRRSWRGWWPPAFHFDCSVPVVAAAVDVLFCSLSTLCFREVPWFKRFALLHRSAITFSSFTLFLFCLFCLRFVCLSYSINMVMMMMTWCPEMTLTCIMVTKPGKWRSQMSVTLSMPIHLLCLRLTSKLTRQCHQTRKAGTFLLWPALWRHQWPLGQMGAIRPPPNRMCNSPEASPTGSRGNPRPTGIFL